MYEITYIIDGITYKMETFYKNVTIKALKERYGNRLTSIKTRKLY